METGLIKFIPELTRCFLSMCWIFDSKQQVVTIDLLICGRINSGGWLWFGINRLFSVFPSLLTSLIELKFYIENTLWYILCYRSQYYMLFLVLFILKCYRHTDICISFLYLVSFHCLSTTCINLSIVIKWEAVTKFGVAMNLLSLSYQFCWVKFFLSADFYCTILHVNLCCITNWLRWSEGACDLKMYQT